MKFPAAHFVSETLDNWEAGDGHTCLLAFRNRRAQNKWGRGDLTVVRVVKRGVDCHIEISAFAPIARKGKPVHVLEVLVVPRYEILMYSGYSKLSTVAGTPL